MSELNSRIREQAETMLNELELLASDKSIEDKSRFAEVVKRLVHIRDELIFAQRSENACGDWLADTNAILSSLFGTEFPLAGLQWERVCETRDAVRKLLKDSQ